MVLDRRARNDESWKQKKLRTPDYLPARRNCAMTVPVVAPAVFGSWPTNERARPSIRTHDSGRETTHDWRNSPPLHATHTPTWRSCMTPSTRELLQYGIGRL